MICIYCLLSWKILTWVCLKLCNSNKGLALTGVHLADDLTGVNGTRWTRMPPVCSPSHLSGCYSLKRIPTSECVLPSDHWKWLDGKIALLLAYQTRRIVDLTLSELTKLSAKRSHREQWKLTNKAQQKFCSELSYQTSSSVWFFSRLSKLTEHSRYLEPPRAVTNNQIR